MRCKIIQIFFYLLTVPLFCCAQSPGATIDIQHYAYNLQLSDSTNQIKGEADITLKFLKKINGFNINLVKKDHSGNGMLVKAVTEKGNQLNFSQENDEVNIITDAIAGSEHTYTIVYEGIPEDGLIISTNKFGKRTFFGDNWPDRAHNWLPCVDDPADKATVDFKVTAPEHYQVVGNGLKAEETALPGNLKLTHWKESIPIATKVMVIGVADFAIDHTGDVNNIAVYSYVFPENKDRGFRDYAMAKDILAFFIKKIGPYAFEKLANVQSKTIYGGMENASAIFYFENSVGDSDVEALMAHEIAHQWFGDAASEKSFIHLWLSEGFATYMTDLYIENKYGGDALKKRLIADREKVIKFESESHRPVVDTSIKSNYKQLLNANSYEKGGWVLHMLRRKLGDTTFWKGIRAYYAKYDGSNANTEDFRTVMEQVSGQDLRQFFKQWLFEAETPKLDYGWQYDKNKKEFSIAIVQKQDSLFQFSLQVLINGRMHFLQIKNKMSHLKISLATDPGQVIVDPGINLLGSFKNVNILELLLKNKKK